MLLITRIYIRFWKRRHRLIPLSKLAHAGRIRGPRLVSSWCELATAGRYSNFSAIVRPMKQCLPLARSTRRITWFTVPLDLGDVAPDGFPALDLASILFWHASAKIIATIPLEPTARVIGMNPTSVAPY